MDVVKGMSENDIEGCLHKLSDFNGVMSYEDLPNRVKSGYYVVNSASKATSGEHWFVMYFPPSFITAEFFDSLGHTPNYYGVENVLISNSEMYKRNTKQLQHTESTLCGQYCVLYCYLKSKHGFTFEQYLSIFSDDLIRNDTVVKFWEKCH